MFSTKISGKAGKGSEMYLLPTVAYAKFAFYTPLIYLKLSNKKWHWGGSNLQHSAVTWSKVLSLNVKLEPPININ